MKQEEAAREEKLALEKIARILETLTSKKTYMVGLVVTLWFFECHIEQFASFAHMTTYMLYILGRKGIKEHPGLKYTREYKIEA